jgi:hypothetical protein
MLRPGSHFFSLYRACPGLLQPFTAHQDACNLDMSVSFSPPFCAEDNQVVILLHKAGLQNTTMYFLEAGKNTSLITVTHIHSECIFMEFGVVLLDADEHLNKPAENDIKDMLRRTTTTPSARVLDT